MAVILVSTVSPNLQSPQSSEPPAGGSKTPRLSVGLPVYNGQTHLREAFETLLNQTFTDFELLVCDNASTDETAAIIAEFAARDPRVRAVRNETNVGAAPNFNRSFELSDPHSEFFCWAAHDDRRDADYFARCIAALDADPTAVLAYPKATIIDEQGDLLEEYELKLATDAADPVARFAALLRGHKCFEVFGVIRRGALASTPRIGSYSHGDGVLLARLALRGRFVEIPESLFFPRRHAGQSMNMLGDYRTYAVWFDTRLAGRMLFPTWRIHWEFFTSIFTAPLTLRQRLGCGWKLFGWVLRRWRLFARDVAYHLRRIIKKYLGVDIHPSRRARSAAR